MATDVGRRILYDSLTGEILHDTGEMSGDVLERPAIQGVIKHLDIPYGQDSDKYIRAITYHVDTDTETVLFDELRPVVVSQDQIISDLENQLLIANGVI